MSKQCNSVLVTAPDFGTGQEVIGEFTGYDCGYCHGNGWLWNPEIIHERVKIPCPKCGGSGKVKASVVVNWIPDGSIKTFLNEI